MLGRIMDTIDDFFGYDRTGVRVVLFAVAIVLSALVIDWGYGELTASDCDARCEAITRELESIPTMTPEEADREAQEIIDEVLKD